ncbi:hypothetical protein [Parendozoicomonas haliclonae]|nr:hypothetical protein [Parendozoicomonas haliclonae]
MTMPIVQPLASELLLPPPPQSGEDSGIHSPTPDDEGRLRASILEELEKLSLEPSQLSSGSHSSLDDDDSTRPQTPDSMELEDLVLEEGEEPGIKRGDRMRTTYRSRPAVISGKWGKQGKHRKPLSHTESLLPSHRRVSRVANIQRWHTVSGSPILHTERKQITFRPLSEYHQQLVDSAETIAIEHDETLKAVMQLMRSEGSKNDLRFWEQVVWKLMMWLVSQSWAGESSLPEQVIVLPYTRLQNYQSVEDKLEITVPVVGKPPPFREFLQRLVAAQKTLSETLLLPLESPWYSPFDRLMKLLESSVAGVVGQSAGSSHEVDEGDPALVVSSTVRVIRSMVTACSGFYEEQNRSLGKDNRRRALKGMATGLEVVTSLARTSEQLSLVMAVLGSLGRIADDRTGAVDYPVIGSLGLLSKSFRLLLDMGERPTQQAESVGSIKGKLVVQTQLGETGLKQILDYILLLANGRMQGLVPIDKAWIDDEVFSSCQKLKRHSMSMKDLGERDMFFTAELFNLSCLPKGIELSQAVPELQQLNRSLYKLSFSPLGEIPETFYMLRTMYALLSWYTDYREAKAVTSPSRSVRNEVRLKDDLKVREQLSVVISALAGMADSLVHGTYVRQTLPDIGPLQKAVTEHFGSNSVKGLNEVGQLLLNLNHHYSSGVTASGK